MIEQKYLELIIRIDANLTNLMDKFTEHVDDDKKLKEKVEFHSKVIYGFLGIVAFLQFINIIHH